MLLNIVYNLLLSIPIIMSGVFLFFKNIKTPDKFNPLNLIFTVGFVNLFIIWVIFYIYHCYVNTTIYQLHQIENPASVPLGFGGFLVLFPIPYFFLINGILFFSYLLSKNLFLLIIHSCIFIFSLCCIFIITINSVNIYNSINLLCMYIWLFISFSFVYKFVKK